jgi:hypothetical protein
MGRLLAYRHVTLLQLTSYLASDATATGRKQVRAAPAVLVSASGQPRSVEAT